eukprot:TRINITY_DN13368_c0_g1_i7.p1 TRINITY_DN13368_c0_g1~~TRINITY_DN13368_c0_g1_i7.p1  ORF type:complete len:1117 (-),score=406.66 TRINITY_DN13368_c0_g1_i7:107-3457(-)
MKKRSSSRDDGYYGRRSGDRDDRSRDRGGGRDDRRGEGKGFRSAKKQRTDSSDTESHHDVEILYKKVPKGRSGSDYDPRNYEEAGSGPSREFQPSFQALSGPSVHNRGKGLLGDAPAPRAIQHTPQSQSLLGEFVHPRGEPGPSHSNYHSQPQHNPGLLALDHDSGGPSQEYGPMVVSKPPITSLLLAMSGSGSHPNQFSSYGAQPLASPDQSPHEMRPVVAKQQKDGFWNLPPMQNSSGSGGRKSDTRNEKKVCQRKEEELPWKSQIKELRDYVLKLENEKKELAVNVETEKIQQLRDYIIKIEVEKQELFDRVDKDKKGSGKGMANEGHMIEMITENIERVKQAQENENKTIESKKLKLLNEEKRLAVEKRKLDKAKEDLKTSLDNGMKFLSAEKNKMELELQKKKHAAKFAADNKMLTRVKALEEAVKEEKETRAQEEKRHLATELEELETRKEMTIKTIESEIKVEELEATLEEVRNELYEIKQKMAKKDSENRNLSSEVAKAAKQNEELVNKLESTKTKLDSELDRRTKELQLQKQNSDAEYAVFIKKREDFDETERIPCVFCPQENLQTISNFIFHIAREHMFDQYKSSNITEESLKVGMFLKVLEDKARKELASEMKVLNDSLEELKESAFKHEEMIEEKHDIINELNDKTSALERDIETLLEGEANYKNQIDNLVLRNNTLQNQMRNSSISETMRIENQEMGKKINVLGREVNDLKEKRLTLEREVDGLRQRWKEESSEKLGWKTRCRDLSSEVDNLKKRMEEQESNKDNVKETLKVELSNSNDEKDKLRQRIRNLEEKVDELVSLKAVAEAQLAETKAENEAIKEFRSDLNAVNDVVCDDMRVENKTLKSKLNSGQNEIKNLKSELSKTKTSKNFVLNELNLAKKEINDMKMELSTVRTENLSAHQRLTEAMERIQVFEKDMEDCLKEQKGFDNEASFTFDMGIDNILKAPLDVINLQIENIDIDQLENIDMEDETVDNVDTDDKVPEKVENVDTCNKGPEKMASVVDDSVVVAAIEIRIDETELEEATRDEEKNGGWSDDEFDYDLLNDSQEEIEERESKENEPLKPGSPHPPGCDCVDCDDCDVLHGYMSGKAQGIREMMRQNSA